MSLKKTYYIETFGCQMNKNDSELMALSMLEHGFEPAEDLEHAEIALFNTCSVREHAENRVISRIRSHRKKTRGHDRVTVVAGCMAQRIGTELIESGIADMVVGPYQSPEIGRLIVSHFMDRSRDRFLSQDTDDLSPRINLRLSAIRDAPPWHRWVTITHGCDNNCSYCIVPLVRGRLISFKSATILEYIRHLAANGIREITLLGQNVNQYGADSSDLPFHKLLEAAAGIEGIERMNFLTSHPKDFSVDILLVIRDHPNISRSIHLPLQSGSDRVLGLMSRGYTRSQYLSLVEQIRNRLPSHSLSTDIIVGFPGETESEFEQTLAAAEQIRFDDAYTYAYSQRRGTPAYSMAESITREEKVGRLKRLIALQRSISRRKLDEKIDRVEEAIIERLSRKSSEEVMGRTFLNHVVITPGTKQDIGKRVKVRIQGVRGTALQGTRIA
ncbi:MAG: tRNA (N6-isopentenyl adenosine(37)-C2)-methylthiotransferase MiaB [Spirochaetes bacterium RBG_16_49_21]|nr:MAG: tRNA (N6-isopentenyl adenosine(37)-C2)-methylthiotransferase MiaB [Spirochaetes bacterium RBG_16_49_21]